MNETRNDKIKFMKIITMFLVVFAHCTRMYTKLEAIIEVPNNTILTIITNFIYGFHLNIFLGDHKSKLNKIN